MRYAKLNFMKNFKHLFKKATVWTVILAMVCWSFGIPLTTLIPEAPKAKAAVSTTIMISEVSAEMGSATAEFVELYNASSTAVNISEWKIEYSAANSGSSWAVKATIPASTNLPAFGFYLASTADFDTASSVDGDTSLTSGLALSGGHIRLINGSTEIDKVGWGTAVNPENTVITAHNANGSIERKATSTANTAATMHTGGVDEYEGNGIDTDDNSADFVVQAVANPQNSSGPIEDPNSTLIITEVKTGEASGTATTDAVYGDWIELKNISGDLLTVGGYQVMTGGELYDLPADLTLLDDQYITIYWGTQQDGGPAVDLLSDDEDGLVLYAGKSGWPGGEVLLTQAGGMTAATYTDWDTECKWDINRPSEWFPPAACHSSITDATKIIDYVQMFSDYSCSDISGGTPPSACWHETEWYATKQNKWPVGEQLDWGAMSPGKSFGLKYENCRGGRSAVWGIYSTPTPGATNGGTNSVSSGLTIINTNPYDGETGVFTMPMINIELSEALAENGASATSNNVKLYDTQETLGDHSDDGDPISATIQYRPADTDKQIWNNEIEIMVDAALTASTTYRIWVGTGLIGGTSGAMSIAFNSHFATQASAESGPPTVIFTSPNILDTDVPILMGENPEQFPMVISFSQNIADNSVFAAASSSIGVSIRPFNLMNYGGFSANCSDTINACGNPLSLKADKIATLSLGLYGNLPTPYSYKFWLDAKLLPNTKYEVIASSTITSASETNIVPYTFTFTTGATTVKNDTSSCPNVFQVMGTNPFNDQQNVPVQTNIISVFFPDADNCNFGLLDNSGTRISSSTTITLIADTNSDNDYADEGGFKQITGSAYYDNITNSLSLMIDPAYLPLQGGINHKITINGTNSDHKVCTVNGHCLSSDAVYYFTTQTVAGTAGDISGTVTGVSAPYHFTIHSYIDFAAMGPMTGTAAIMPSGPIPDDGGDFMDVCMQCGPDNPPGTDLCPETCGFDEGFDADNMGPACWACGPGVDFGSAGCDAECEIGDGPDEFIMAGNMEWRDIMTDSNGAFTVNGLPDGDYVLEQMPNPDFTCPAKFGTQMDQWMCMSPVITIFEKSITKLTIKEFGQADVIVSAHGDADDIWTGANTLDFAVTQKVQVEVEGILQINGGLPRTGEATTTVEVRLEGSSFWGSTYPANDGSFSFSNVPSGTYKLVTWNSYGYPNIREAVTIEATDPTDIGIFNLAIDATAVTISGTVTIPNSIFSGMSWKNAMIDLHKQFDWTQMGPGFMPDMNDMRFKDFCLTNIVENAATSTSGCETGCHFDGTIYTCDYSFAGLKVDTVYEIFTHAPGAVENFTTIDTTDEEGNTITHNVTLSGGVSIPGIVVESNKTTAVAYKDIDMYTPPPTECMTNPNEWVAADHGGSSFEDFCFNPSNMAFGWGRGDSNGLFTIRGLKAGAATSTSINYNLNIWNLVSGQRMSDIVASSSNSSLHNQSILNSGKLKVFDDGGELKVLLSDGTSATLGAGKTIEKIKVVLGVGVRLRATITSDGVTPLPWSMLDLDGVSEFFHSMPAGPDGALSIMGLTPGKTYSATAFNHNGGFQEVSFNITIPETNTNNIYDFGNITISAFNFINQTTDLTIDKKTVTVDKSLAAPGDDVTFTIKLNNETSATTTENLIITLPSNEKINDDYTKMYIDGSLQATSTYTVANNVLTKANVSVGPASVKNIVVIVQIDVNLTNADEAIKLEASFGDALLGNAFSRVAFATIEGPAVAAQGSTIKVYGKVSQDASITVKDANETVATAQANGKWWNATVTFAAGATVGDHNLIVTATRNGVTSQGVEPLVVAVIAAGGDKPILYNVAIPAGWNGTVNSASSTTGVATFSIFEGEGMTDITATFDIVNGAAPTTVKIAADFLTSEITMTGSGATWQGSIAEGWTGYGERQINIKYTYNSVEYTQTVAEALILIDPSGYIYDTDTNNRIQGVTATLDQLQTVSNDATIIDIVGADSNSDGDISDAEETAISNLITSLTNYDDTTAYWATWDAAATGQINPQTTDELGKYGWNVPQGWYRVKFEKTDEYSQSTSRVVYVPPAETELNLDLGSYNIAAPTITGKVPAASASSTPTNISAFTVTFSKAMNANTINTSNITVYQGVTAVNVTVAYNSTNRTVTITPATIPLSANAIYRISLNTNVKDNAGTSLTGATEWTFTTGSVADNTTPDSAAVATGTLVSDSYVGSVVIALTAYTDTNKTTVDNTATIYYTTDGTTPSTASNVYSSALTFTTGKTLNYFAKDVAGNTEAMNTLVFTVSSADATPPNVVAVDGSGYYSSSRTVALTAYMDDTNSNPSNVDSGATIYWTADGSTPTTASTQYATALTINGAVGDTVYLKTLATDSTGNQSAVKTFTYLFVASGSELQTIDINQNTIALDVGTPQFKLTNDTTQTGAVNLQNASTISSPSATTVEVKLDLSGTKNSNNEVTLTGNNSTLSLTHGNFNIQFALGDGGTKITGPTGWDGMLTIPQLNNTYNNQEVISGNQIQNAINVGASGKMTFSKAVQLIFANQGGQSYTGAYKDENGVWHAVPTCGSISINNQATANSVLQENTSPGECYIDNGADLFFWTKHFTTFAITSAIATPAQTPGGSVNSGSVSYCSNVEYDQWQTTCVNNLQYRNIKSRLPSGCTLTSSQESARKKACNTEEAKTTLPEIIKETKETISEAVDATKQAAQKFAQKIVDITSDAADIVKANVNALLGKLGFKRDLAKEQVSVKKYIKSLIKNVAGLPEQSQHALTNFIAYGTPTTLGLGEGERAGVVNSYKSAFGKLPSVEEEWNDAIKIANGRWPGETSEKAETRATTNFKAVYLREPDRSNPHDDAAIVVMAYGLRPADRNLDSEKAAIKIFKAIYGYNPEKATAWDVVRAIAYSGATR